MEFEREHLDMRGNNKMDGDQVWLSILQNQLDLSPRAQMLVKMLSATSNRNDDDTEDIEVRDKAEIQHMRRDVQDLEDELDEALEMLDVLAEAIGACGLCFGGHDECEACHGRGRAGWQKPDMELFSHFVAPAVQRLRPNIRGARRIGNDRHEPNHASTHKTAIKIEGDDHV